MNCKKSNTKQQHQRLGERIENVLNALISTAYRGRITDRIRGVRVVLFLPKTSSIPLCLLV